MEIKLLKNEKDYKKASRRLYDLFQVKELSKNYELSNEFDILALLVEDYEKKYYPIEYPNNVID